MESQKSQSFQEGWSGTLIAFLSLKQLKAATVMNNKVYNMKLLALSLSLLFVQGCSQKLGYTPNLNNRAVALARLFTLSEITETATLMATDNRLYATGAKGLFGYYNFTAGGYPSAFISGTSALNTDGRALNFIDGNSDNVLSMVQAGSHLVISSNPGLYQINSQDRLLTLRLALPYAFLPQPDVMAKERYRFDSMVYVPSQNQILGFRGSFAYRLNLNEYQPSPFLVNQGLNSACDGSLKYSSAYFQNYVLVASCNGVNVLQSNGQVVSPGASGADMFSQLRGLNAVQIVATRNYLYVHNQPENGYYYRSSSQYEPGIYVFDSSFRMLNTIPIPITPVSFAVSPDDQILYANEDDLDIGAYRIPWTNQRNR